MPIEIRMQILNISKHFDSLAHT